VTYQLIGGTEQLPSPGNQAQDSDNRHSSPHNSIEGHSPVRRFNFGPGSFAPDSVKTLFKPCKLVRPNCRGQSENYQEVGKCRFHIESQLGDLIDFVEQSRRPAVDATYLSRDDDLVTDGGNRCVESRTSRSEGGEADA
jgi:hypothetical protein